MLEADALFFSKLLSFDHCFLYQTICDTFVYSQHFKPLMFTQNVVKIIYEFLKFNTWHDLLYFLFNGDLTTMESYFSSAQPLSQTPSEILN